MVDFMYLKNCFLQYVKQSQMALEGKSFQLRIGMDHLEDTTAGTSVFVHPIVKEFQRTC